MIYDDGYYIRFNPEKDDYELVKVVSGTMLIEALLLEKPNLYGRFRFTLAHELAHWILHKRLFIGTCIAAASYNVDNCSVDSIEWQANYLAKAILMPAGQIKRGFYQTKTNSETETSVISNLANIFEVSKQALQIRLNELGLN
jgi:Zn-dependent peptidase ImmA (M78 family)